MAADVRALAARAVADVLAGYSLNRALPAALEKVSPRDRGLLQQLCYGTLRHAPRLQAIAAQLLDKPLRDKDRDVQALLLIGLYQLDGMRIPDHAAVDATVSATKTLKKNWARGMTNAVLRRFLRERETLAAALDKAASASHPAWLYDRIAQQWPEQAAAIMHANNQQPPMTLRANQSAVTRDNYLARLLESSIAATPGNISPNAITLEQPVDVLALPGFAEGLVSVQDEAAQLAALLLAPNAGETVLDACAAPGGKTCHLLELQPKLSNLVAMDIDDDRLERIEENLARLKLDATVVALDAAAAAAEMQGQHFDKILVDAPCSASGVIRRHPDVKLLRQESDIDSFAEQQLQILHGVWPLLRPGGTLLYVTCSILDEENSGLIKRFLKQTENAQLVTLEEDWGVTMDCGRQLLPTSSGTDGLFFAKLHRVS